MEVSGQYHSPAILLPGKKPSTHWIGGPIASVFLPSHKEVLPEHFIFGMNFLVYLYFRLIL
jgi:hypothetical protein